MAVCQKIFFVFPFRFRKKRITEMSYAFLIWCEKPKNQFCPRVSYKNIIILLAFLSHRRLQFVILYNFISSYCEFRAFSISSWYLLAFTTIIHFKWIIFINHKLKKKNLQNEENAKLKLNTRYEMCEHKHDTVCLMNVWKH